MKLFISDYILQVICILPKISLSFEISNISKFPIIIKKTHNIVTLAPTVLLGI